MSNHERDGAQSPGGDAGLDRAWQRLSDEQPPSALDAAIIAAARQSIRGRDEPSQIKRASPPQRSWLTRWQPLAAAAAVAGLAFVLVQSLPRDRDVGPTLQREAPATAPAAAQEHSRVPASREASEAKIESPPAQAVVRESVTAPVSTMDQQSAAATATPMPAAEVDQRQRAAGEMTGRTTSAAAAAPAPVQATAAKAAAGDDVAPPDAAGRAARIASLYAGGDVAGAADALREFRAVVPDADTYLPESLGDWARTVE
jgi:resuscitation-promoting factor RpfA